MQTIKTNWQQIIWREWRYSKDKEYARYLFELVADSNVGWGAKVAAMLLNGLAGAAIAVLLGLVVIPQWSAMQHLIWVGTVFGLLRGWLVSRHLTWRKWLERLSANTPVVHPTRLLVGVVGLGLVGGMIFGPLSWLVAFGMFWLFGDIVQWITRGLTIKPQDSDDERQWWFWWHKPPHLLQVEAALKQAIDTTTNDETQAIWQPLFSRLTDEKYRHMPIPDLIDLLSGYSWRDRFLARQSLLRRGHEAAGTLQAIAAGETPLRSTALRLLENIQRLPQPVPESVQ